MEIVILGDVQTSAVELEPYTQEFAAAGGTGFYTWSISGALPDGLSFVKQGSVVSISGAPSEGSEGSYPITITLSDTLGWWPNDSVSFTLSVTLPAAEEPAAEPEPESEPEPEPEPEEEASPPAVPDGPYTLRCFWDADDVDGDGYAAAGSKSYLVGRELNNRLTCPAGYVPATGDCDDSSASIHPRRGEIAFNGVDDNCNGLTDEPAPVYPSSSSRSFETSFEMIFKLNDQAAAAVEGDLYADVEYARLRDSANAQTRSKVFVSAYTSGGSRYAKYTLDGLSTTTVYRARVRFFSRAGTSYSALGPLSPWYYTTTNGTTEKSIVRTKIVVKALKQHSDALEGKVGTLGTVDVNGTRYGADHDEWWCSEFYAWNASSWLKGVGSKTSVDALKSYFSYYDGYYTEADIGVGDRGDWVSIDGHHSTMLLAIEKNGSTNKDDWSIWTVEGNTGDSGGVPVPANNVGVKKRKVSSYVMGLGHIMSSQLL
ncbi:MAG: putative metal-binding motif-containing protein [Proteobacteria bacterium]|nr:putative metal-binding motif-containing protein [Pseudomonadota bacterium]